MSIRIQKLNTTDVAETGAHAITLYALEDEQGHYTEDFVGTDTYTVNGHFIGAKIDSVVITGWIPVSATQYIISVRYDNDSETTTIIARYEMRFNTQGSLDHVNGTATYKLFSAGPITTVVDITDKVEQPVNFSWRLDRELDGAGFTYIETDTAHKSRIVEPLTLFRVQHLEDGVITDEQIMVGTDERTVLRPTTAVMSGLFRHRVQLTEASKLLQGVLIDGSHTTQVESEEIRKTVADEVERLLSITPCRTADQLQKYFLDTTDGNYQSLANAVAPQFTFNTQSTLWECLCEAFSVVDSIPELVITLDEVHHKLTYLIRAIQPNRPTAVIDSLVDNATYSYGEQVNAEQVNSGLTAVAENIFEE